MRGTRGDDRLIGLIACRPAPATTSGGCYATLDRDASTHRSRCFHASNPRYAGVEPASHAHARDSGNAGYPGNAGHARHPGHAGNSRASGNTQRRLDTTP